MRMAERINLVPGSEDGVRAAAAVVFSRPHGREDCEEEQAHRVGLGAVLCDECAESVQNLHAKCTPQSGSGGKRRKWLPGAIKRDMQFTAYGILTRKLILRPEPYA